MRLPVELERKALEDKALNVEIRSVRHLPIVSEYAKRIGLVETINRLVPSQMAEDPGTIVLGLVLDTLSGRTPLYRLPEFFREYDSELLLGRHVDPSAFEDYSVGRVMDRCFQVGCSMIFSEVATNALAIMYAIERLIRFDTTSVSVYGDYAAYSKEAENAPFAITQGHSKDHRPDLKQFMLSMLCVNRNIPFFGKIEDGNGSDKRINNEVLSSISSHMAKHGIEPGAFIYIADSALVTGDNLELMGDDIHFITRLPANYGECDRLIKEAMVANEWKDAGVLAITKPTINRPAAFYKTYETETTIHGRKYRAVVVYSTAHDKRRQKKMDRELSNEKDALDKMMRKASGAEYFCEADALKAIEQVCAHNLKFHKINAEIEERPRYKRGRPKGGVRQVREMRYGMKLELEEDVEAVQKLRSETGCFVLISNVPTEFLDERYDDCKILSAYKDQYGIEQNFGFLKDPAIVNGIFLDKAERIEALGLILLLSLLIWRLIEHDMRQYLKKSGKSLPGWEKRRTQRPTSFMLTTKFSNIFSFQIGRERRLSKPLNHVQLEYLEALNIDPCIFMRPRYG